MKKLLFLLTVPILLFSEAELFLECKTSNELLSKVIYVYLMNDGTDRIYVRAKGEDFIYNYLTSKDLNGNKMFIWYKTDSDGYEERFAITKGYAYVMSLSKNILVTYTCKKIGDI
jgi:hypothetical protein